MNSSIKKLETTIKKIQEKINLNPEQSAKKHETIQEISNRIKEIKAVRYKHFQDIAKANWRLQGELVNKHWCQSGKEKKGRDTIMEMRRVDSSPPNYTTNSTEMSKEMAKHHINVQKLDTDTPKNIRQEETTNLLKDMPKINELDANTLAKELEYSEIEMAIKESPNDKAPGLNGIPTELYKTLHKRFTTTQKEQKPCFNVIKLLQMAYNDIINNGTTTKTELLEGWLCPIYKKKDRREAVNYRPITILNAEYKILTTAIMNRLSLVAPKIIHKCQAAFVKGRSIFDQIDLTTRMLQLSEKCEQNGAIILLDQEKAYDRIRHDYLWQVLETANVPANLINLIKALYKNARTTVILNGTLSPPFPVERGVRQGDPLSCLLFNLAIEPMSKLI